MLRKEAKELLPIIQAFAEGKEIQYRNSFNEWIDIKKNEGLSFIKTPLDYRIKPESKYRPFKSQEECWNEMLKHQPFGWLKSKKNERHFSIGSVFWDNDFNDVYVTFAYDGMLSRSSKSVFEDFTFADGAPFGIMEE